MTEVRCLRPAYESYEHFYVLNDKTALPDDMKDKTHFIAHSERDWKFLLNFWEAFRVLWIERPHVVLSTGAGPAVPFAVVGRLLFGLRVIFVESITRIQKPSLTGKFMYWLADDFFYQWKALTPFFPKARYGGLLL